MAIPHDCTRFTELVSFIECQGETSRSGWFLDYFFRDRRTTAEKLEFRNYQKSDAAPLFYVGACEAPNIVKPQTESFGMIEAAFPSIKAETKITGCDVDERRILPNGDVLPVGMQRFNEAFNHNMSAITEGLRATHTLEAISLLKTGAYILPDTETTNVGTLDFGRNTALAAIDLVGTPNDFCEPCAKPSQTIENIAREMGKCGGLAGVIDVVHSPESWRAMEAHVEREEIRYQTPSGLTGTQQTLFTSYNDVQFKGATNGGQIRHWVSFAMVTGYDGVLAPVLAPGQMLIASRAAFDGQRVFRTITSDNREMLPNGQNFFLYDDLEKEYNRKCRSFAPWIEEYHLMVPSNVNGATVIQAVDPTCEPCVQCEEC